MFQSLNTIIKFKKKTYQFNYCKKKLRTLVIFIYRLPKDLLIRFKLLRLLFFSLTENLSDVINHIYIQLYFIIFYFLEIYHLLNMNQIHYLMFISSSLLTIYIYVYSNIHFKKYSPNLIAWCFVNIPAKKKRRNKFIWKLFSIAEIIFLSFFYVFLKYLRLLNNRNDNFLREI